jgi:hypothetical protein
LPSLEPCCYSLDKWCIWRKAPDLSGPYSCRDDSS